MRTRLRAVPVLFSAAILAWLPLMIAAGAAAAQPAPDMLPERLRTAAATYREDIARRHADAASISRLLTMGEARAALDGLEYAEAVPKLERVVAVSPDDTGAWIALAASLVLQQEPDFASATAAAANAYLAAGNDIERAVSLALISEVEKLSKQDQEPREPWEPPPPLTSLELAAEGDDAIAREARRLADGRDLAPHFRAIVEGYPAVLVPTGIEPSTTSDLGGACITFNHPLTRPGSVRYNDFVEVRPAVRDLAVTVGRSRLCAEGLPFGADATIVLKAGLPGRGGDALSGTVEMPVFVPDREPSVAFRERGYVLPAHGRQILPVESVNVDRAQIRVVRIVERNLADQIGERFLDDLGRWEVDQIVEQQGELVFEGTAEIESERNRSATTGLALADLIGEPLEPGVYAVVVRDDLAADSWEADSTQWLVVSDIGLSLFQGPDGLHVFATSLASAQPLDDVALTVVARNNRELVSTTTDANGRALVAAAILNGSGGNEPLYIRASRQGKEFTFVSLGDSAFDLSDRGVTGREPSGAVDAYVFTERGIYRPGETINAVALTRRPDGGAWAGPPVVFRVLRPDGNEVLRETSADAGAGGHAIEISTTSSSMAGAWTVLAHIDPEAPPIGRTTFLLQDFVPPRIELDGSASVEAIAPLEKLTVDVQADYLFGAPATGLRATGEITLRSPEEPFPEWAGYRFGLEEEPWTPVRFPMSEAETDDAGKVTVSGVVEADPDTTQPLVAEARVDVFEPGGRARSLTVAVPLRHQDYAIGIKPRFEDGQAPSDAPAAFDIVAVSPDGSQRAASLEYVLWEEDWRFVWFRSGDDWDHEVIVDDRQQARGTLSLDGTTPARIAETVGWGRYRLEVFDPKTGIATSVRFRAGWGVATAPDRPDTAEVTLDAESYSPGDTARAFVRAPFEGRLLLLRAGRSLDVIYDGPISAEGREIAFEVDRDSASLPGSYLIATVFRPGEASRQQMPTRAIGIAWLAIAHADREMEVAVDVPETARPGRTLRVDVEVANAGPEARLVVAAVDDAVLQVTNFESPDPAGHFFAQHRLAYEVRDIYGRLIDPYGAERAVVREGGDQMPFNPNLSIRSSRIVSLFSGIVRPGPDGRATVELPVPDFAGRLRIMAVAWNADRVGSAESQVVVRNPVVAELGLPRFLAPGDVAEATLSINNVEGPSGDYHVTVGLDGPLVLGSEPADGIRLERGKSTNIPVVIEAGGIGIGSIRVAVTGPNDLMVVRNWKIEVRPAQPRVTMSTYVELAPGKKRTLSSRILSGLLTGTETARLSVGVTPDFHRDALLDRLASYAYRCTEQTTSRAIAFLATNAANHRDEEIAAAIQRLVSLQKGDGSFGFWSPWDSGGQWLTAFVADFLIRAARDGFAVPGTPRERAIHWLRDSVRPADVPDESLSGYAYAHYVLAEAEADELSRLRHFANVYGEELPSPMDVALVSAALARYGDVSGASEAFSRALAMEPDKERWANYGTPMRDRAATIALLAEVATDPARLLPAAKELAARTVADNGLSTQEMSWLVRAAASLKSVEQDFALEIDGRPVDGHESYRTRLTRADLGAGVTLENAGDAPLVYEVSVSGVPGSMLPAEANGYQIERRILTREGEPVDLAALKRGDLVLVHLSGESLRDEPQEVLLVDMLPAGLEIEGDRLAAEDLPADLRAAAEGTVEPSHVEARDDRFVAAWTLEGKAQFAVAYLARAVTPGRFVLPAPYIENMYRPELHARGEAGRIEIGR